MAAGNSKNTGRKTTNTKKEQEKETQNAQSFRTEIILWCIVAVSLFMFISNFGIGGAVGHAVSSVLFGVFGLIAYILPIILLIGSFFAVSNKENSYAFIKLVEAALLVVFFCVLVSLIVSGKEPLGPPEAYTYSAENKGGGGFIGGAIAYVMVKGFGLAGAYIINIILMIICIVLLTERSALAPMKRGGRKVYETAKENNERYRQLREERREERKVRRMDRKVTGISPDTKITARSQEQSDEMEELHPEALTAKAERTVALTAHEPKRTESVVASPAAAPAPEPVAAPVRTEPVITGDFTRETAVVEPISPANASTDMPPAARSAGAVSSAPKAVAAEEPKKNKPLPEEEIEKEIAQVVQEISAQEQPKKEYVFPPVSLLAAGSGKKAGNTERELKETAGKLQQVLATFGVNVTVTNISCGPSVTRYEIQPEMGVKVSKIVGLADDIKLNLAAADIRIEAPIPGKAAVGIEVPNRENVTVAFRELIESQDFKDSKSKISFAVGKDIAGKVQVTDIGKMPHLLIAGATGSGKSVCINTIIMSILYKAKPDEVKLLMIDPKVVELSVYNGIPHLMIPVVTDPKKASGALNWAVAEMTERYEKFAEANVREISGYNAKVDSIQVPEGVERPKKLPQIVIIVDELADLMMVASGDVEEAICRLAQLARAAGIHLVIATQRPSVNVITGLIKANMPSRIAFAVTSGTDSRTILDMVGAEKLLGKGDMLFHPQGMPKPLRVQGAFVSDKEVGDVVAFITEQNGAAVYSDSVQQKVEAVQNSSNNTVSISDADEQEDGRDSYFAEAARLIVDKDKASIGMLQRYLKVGFNRAARIMDQMEEAGIVGPEEGTKPRRVQMEPEELEIYLSENT